jgi:hypothetical protein
VSTVDIRNENWTREIGTDNLHYYLNTYVVASRFRCHIPMP